MRGVCVSEIGILVLVLPFCMDGERDVERRDGV